ncbi:MAG: plastocyanin/azurin family copper-binding protein [Gemmatimonadales bacterium]
MRPVLFTILIVATAYACSSSSSSSGAGPTGTTSANCTGSGASATVAGTDGQVFTPSSATITHGQSVCWQVNGGSSHTVTSNDGTSFNANISPSQVFTHTFATAGTFPYRCTIHAGMTGTITVN